MKILYTLFLLGCPPSDLEIAEDSDQFEITEPPAPPNGVIAADDCRHVDRGDLACNFILHDQNSENWELYNHMGEVTVLDFSTIWCYPCQVAGNFAQPIQDDYADQGVNFVTVLIDGMQHSIEPTQDEISEWVQSHGITTAPILQGSREKMLSSDSSGYDGYLLGGFPTYVYIGKDMKFYSAHVGFNEEHVRQTIEEGL